jgi:predicted N-acyltransferase
MSVEFVDSIDEVAANDWNALVGHRYPFLHHEFLSAAEQTGCVSPETGWQPRHALLRDSVDRLSGAMLLYEKTHSWGEFVFDWAWAQAYQRAGLEYYPKLVSAVPFTPAPSPRLLLADGAGPDAAAALVEGALDLAARRGLSSLHVLFPLPAELPIFEAAGLMPRKDCQFHWHNHGYRSFDDFLATFSSAKRKKARRDRRQVVEQGIGFRWLRGDELDAAQWSIVYEMISNTFLQRGSMPYYDLDFFMTVAARLPRNILVVLAERPGKTVACAMFYRDDRTLYGRYWGSESQYNALHFETCYDQGIDYCIASGLQCFEPGTQGEHKISRGFVPVATWSAHWIAQPEFGDAISRYLREEIRHVDRYIAAVDSHSPYRKLSP